jgi:hypothetical protein
MAQDPYVKLFFSYYDDVALAALDDSAEVMFTRGMAWSGRAKTKGFIPTTKLLELTRKTNQAAAVKVANSLCRRIRDKQGPWEKADGGYIIRNFERIQEELITLQNKRDQDAARQRAKRERDRQSQETSRDTSRDRPTDVTDPSKAKQSEDTAAAASRGGGPALTGEVRVFADKFRSVPAFRDISFEVDQKKLDELRDLILLHGDRRLIDNALQSSFNPVPSFVSAFLTKWRALSAPGAGLALVEPICPECHLTIAACDSKAITEPEFCPRKDTA